MSFEGTGWGAITTDDGLIECQQYEGQCELQVYEGEEIILRAVSVGVTHHVRWRGPCDAKLLESRPDLCKFTVNDDMHVSAEFAEVIPMLPLRVEAVGLDDELRGSVNFTGHAGACRLACETELPQGTVIVAEAVADPGSRFVRWEGAPCNGSTDPVCAFALLSQVRLKALFESDGSTVEP